MAMMDDALELAEAGLAVFPLKPNSKEPATKHGFKDATTDAEQVRAWWSATPTANIGIATGSKSKNVFVIDVDEDERKNKHGMATIRTWGAEHGHLQPTLAARTGRGGMHLYYWTDKRIKNTTNATANVDLRGEGGYVVAPPSVHPNGNSYEWCMPFSSDAIAEADENVLSFIDSLQPASRRQRDASSRSMPEKVHQGERNNALTSYVGKLQRQGAPDETIARYSAEFNSTRMDVPLENDERDRILGSVLTYRKGVTYGEPGEPFKGVEWLKRNERQWSVVFANWLEGAACYVPEERGWRFWDGRHWMKDGDAQRVNRLCKQFVDELMTYAQLSPGIDETTRQDFVSFVNRYNKFAERRKLIEDAKCEVTIPHARFDADPNLLNLQNGTLRLDTLEFRAGHDPRDLLGKIAGVSYDPDATCEEWERFISESLGGNVETIEFLQEVLALGITCDTSAECMFILCGPTRGGKSTTTETEQRLLNPGEDGYACSCNPETFAVKRFDDASRPSSDIARLAGRRFVVTSEPPKNMLFNVARLKQLTGRDMITARFLHENEIQFYPEFTLVMTANDAPKVNDMTLFDSDRVHVIPFGTHLEADQRDPKLKDRLCAPESLSGILNWLLVGLKRYRDRGRLAPSMLSVLATTAYRTNSDKLQSFVCDCLTEVSTGCVTGRAVYSAYQTWCRESGYQAEGKQSFFQELRERGLMVETYTFDGKTLRNAVPGYLLTNEE